MEIVSPTNTYLLGNILGQGTYGIVYEATVMNTGKKVALKQLKKSKNWTFYIEGLFSKLIQNKEECQKYAGCIEDYFKIQDQVYIVMNLIRGFPLSEFINKLTAKERYSALKNKLAVQLVTGLNYFHNMGIYHLDIKPLNIVLDCTDLTPKFVDWGSVCFEDKYEKILKKEYYGNSETKKFTKYKLYYDKCTQTVGTIKYFPPELFDDILIEEAENSTEKIFGKSRDIWALGITIGKWYKDETVIIREPTGMYTDSQIKEFTSTKYPYVTNILKLMLEKDPYKRIKNWDKVLDFTSKEIS